MKKPVNILIPMGGGGRAFVEAGYTFPKPIIDVGGKTMIELVIENIKPKMPHRFIFVCLKEHYDKYDLYNIFKRTTDNHFEVVTNHGPTRGAAPAALTAIEYINNDNELIIANADQYILSNINEFIETARREDYDGHIMTFPSSHPKWSYARTNSSKKVLETAEKKVISNNATVGIYYFKKGSDFVHAVQAMIEKDITHQNLFYICPSFNELILEGKNISIYPIQVENMYSLGTPEDLALFERARNQGWLKKKVAMKTVKRTVRKKPKKKKR